MQIKTKHMNALQEETYNLIGKHLRASENSFGALKSIRKKTRSLWHKYGLTFSEIQHHIYEKFTKRQVLENYDPTRSSLSTYTVHKTLGSIKNLEKSLDRIYGNNQFKLLKVFCAQNSFNEESRYLAWLENDPVDDESKKPEEKLWVCDYAPVLDRLIEYRTPEDIVIEKEILGLAYEHFDETDRMVLRKDIKREQAAERLSITKDAYTKRLQRKVASFRIIATRAGHC